MTSLAEQLKKLAVPESSFQADRKKKPSLLFEPHEAAKLDRDTFYKIGLDGLRGLIQLEPAFQSFSDTLFDMSSRHIERTVESRDINKKLDKDIAKFLKLLSPYLLLKHSHKVLEWLICRFQIQSFNIENLFGLILPYHETKIFVQILRLINLNLPYTAHWHWLKDIQQKGVHLPKSVLINHALSDSSFLRFICDLTLKTISVNKKYNCAQKLGTLLSFFSSTLVCVLSKETINDHHLTILLPSLMKALTDDLTDFRASGYMIAGELVATNQVSKVLVDKILELLLPEQDIFQKEKTYLLLLIFQTQKPPPNIPAKFLSQMSWMIKELKIVAEEGVQVGPLLLKLLEACLQSIVDANEQMVDAQVLAYTVATEILWDLEHCKSLIWMIDSCYTEIKEAMKDINYKKNNSATLTWMKELLDSTIDKHRNILDNDHEDQKFQKLRDKWKAGDELALEQTVLVDLMKKCQGDDRESAWLQLRPLLLEKIENENIFEALCKVAPFYDNLVLLLCLEKVLNPKYSDATKLSKISKLFKSKFGGNNPHIQEINTLLTKNKNQGVTEVIENYFLKQQTESENSIEFEPWFAALQELKQTNKIPDSNEIWNLGIKVLLVSLPSTFSATYALQILSMLSSLKKKKIRIRFEVLKSITNYISTNKKKEIKWYDLMSSNSEIWLKVRFLEYILTGVHEDSNAREEYNACLDNFSKYCFFNQQEFIRLLSAVCCNIPISFESSSLDHKISPLFQIYTLHVSWLQLKVNDHFVFSSFQSELTVVLSYILISLNNESGAIRKAVLKLLEALVILLKEHEAYSEAVIFDKLLERSTEISMDPNQVSVALYYLLSPCEAVQATLHYATASALSNTRSSLLKIISAEDTPLYISLHLLKLLESVNSLSIIEDLTELGHRVLLRSKESEIPRMILSNFWNRINETTSDVLEKENVWELAIASLKHEKCDSFCPAVSFLKSITKEVFEKLSDKRKFQLLEAMITTRCEIESPETANAIASVIKKIYLDCKIILPVTNQMVMVCNTPQKKKEPSKNVEQFVIETKEWKKGISLLELIQSKKKLINSHVLIEPLFDVLKFCLDQEEQTTFEYTKQLILGCLLDCCKKLSIETEKIKENDLHVELVVQCLRASPNPQTHHHALMLLTYLSALIPKQVMQNVMAIFTFMGTSVARLDDEHSVKIVTQVVDAVVPALVEAINSENDDLQSVIAEILRVFVWAIKDIPQHRRKPLLLQLLSTLQPENSLWMFLLLLFENYVSQGDGNKNQDVCATAKNPNIPTNHYLGLQLCFSTSPKIVLEALVKILNYLMELPFEKMNKESQIKKIQDNIKEKKSDGLFDVDTHTPKQLRHFSYTILVFLNTLLADNSFIAQVAEESKKQETSLEESLKEIMALIMKYTPLAKKQLDKQQTKFWKAVVHQSYEIFDKFVLLVPNKILISVIKKLLNHSMKSLRRKALDLLNSLLQTHSRDFTKQEKNSVKQLLDPVVEIIKTIGKEVEQEDVLLQQTALLSLKLLAKYLSADDIQKFKKILITVSNICKSKTIGGPLLGSVMLTVAELVGCLKVHSISELPVIMPLMLKVFVKNADPKTYNELGLNSITLGIHKVVDALPNFLSPYLDKLLYNICTISVRMSDKVDLVKKLTQIRLKLASNIEHRILIPAISRSYKNIIESEEFEASGPLFNTLSSSFTGASDVSKVIPEVTQLFITALSFRSDCEIDSREVSLDNINKLEENIIEALVPFVLKLSEPMFKPLYYQLFHWSSEHPDRSITFFRLSHGLAESLKGLFVLFAGNILQKAATLLDANNLSKTESPFFGMSPKGEAKAIMLLENILKTLHSVFLYDSADSSNFLNKDKFEVLLHPLVDQLENTLGGVEELEKRTSTLLTPCLAQMATAIDDTLWKSLNYQILLKSKSILPQVRIGALETIIAIAMKLGDDYLMLLPETIGSLAELLEDEDERVENAMKNAIQRLEEVLGQPIREYFQ